MIEYIPGTQFLDRYDMPEDQAAAEAALLDEFKCDYPHALVTLEANLATLRRATGSYEPTHKVTGIISGRPSQEEIDKILDNKSYLYFPWGPGSISMLYAPPDNEVHVHGPLLPEGERMFEGLYQLIGARTLRHDDRRHAHIHQRTIRKGVYNNAPVYLRETFTNFRPDYQQIFSVAVIGETILGAELRGE